MNWNETLVMTLDLTASGLPPEQNGILPWKPEGPDAIILLPLHAGQHTVRHMNEYQIHAQMGYQTEIWYADHAHMCM